MNTVTACLNCGKLTSGKLNKYCSRKCLYTSDTWKELVKNKTKDAIISHGSLGVKICDGCTNEFHPWNYRQRFCGECTIGLTKKQRLRLTRYKLTISELKLLDDKDECDLCNNKPQVVDHDHKSQIVRGYLCVTCNMGIHSVEKEGWTERALKYLGKNNL